MTKDQFWGRLLNFVTGVMGSYYIWYYTAKIDRLDLFWLGFAALIMQILFMPFDDIHALIMSIIDKNYKNKDD